MGRDRAAECPRLLERRRRVDHRVEPGDDDWEGAGMTKEGAAFPQLAGRSVQVTSRSTTAWGAMEPASPSASSPSRFSTWFVVGSTTITVGMPRILKP